MGFVEGRHDIIRAENLSLLYKRNRIAVGTAVVQIYRNAALEIVGRAGLVQENIFRRRTASHSLYLYPYYMHPKAVLGGIGKRDSVYRPRRSCRCELCGCGGASVCCVFEELCFLGVVGEFELYGDCVCLFALGIVKLALSDAYRVFPPTVSAAEAENVGTSDSSIQAVMSTLKILFAFIFQSSFLCWLKYVYSDNLRTFICVFK